MIVLVYCIVSK